MKTFKEFTKKEIIGHAISIAGIVVTVVFIAKPDNVINNLYENKYFVPVSGLVAEIKQAVIPEEKEKQNAKIAYSTSSVASVPVVKEVAKVEKKEPVKVEVKEEQVATSTDVAKIATPEVKEDPFEVVKHNFTYDVQDTESTCVKNLKVGVTAINRQGTLERVTKLEIVSYGESGTPLKNDFVKEVSKDQNKDNFEFTGVLCREYGAYMQVRATSFTNYGEVKYYTSDWFTIK